jgi:methylenetetrahydrofolate dehydrogenase (NADP+) / methenyltetrahydrofolate cyclohydrolase
MDGEAVADGILAGVARRAAAVLAATGRVPCLAVVLDGDDRGAVRQADLKRARCRATGIDVRIVGLTGGDSTARVAGVLRDLSGDNRVDAVLFQTPAPTGVDEPVALGAIAAAKDVDGAAAGIEGVAPRREAADVAPCAAAGILRLLDHYGVDPDGRPAVVIGGGHQLGRPVATLLEARGATVTVVDPDPDPDDLAPAVRAAELVIAAAGRPGLVRGTWLRPGSVVVDAGYGQGPLGDVRTEEAFEVASLLAPVPGGVGPMTVAVLLERTVELAERHRRPRGRTAGGAGAPGPPETSAPIGDPACWAGLLCADCGAVVDGSVHRPGCTAATSV